MSDPIKPPGSLATLAAWRESLMLIEAVQAIRNASNSNLEDEQETVTMSGKHWRLIRDKLHGAYEAEWLVRRGLAATENEKHRTIERIGKVLGMDLLGEKGKQP